MIYTYNCCLLIEPL